MATQPVLFPDLPVQIAPGGKVRAITNPVWTENKAKLIARYLRYFVYITKHGAYIDGFAAPKAPDVPDSWAAELVLRSEPKRLREFFLCELKTGRIGPLIELKSSQPSSPKRHIDVLPGDFNQTVHKILCNGHITDKKATFCLIDQFTCQCHWSTLEALASHKVAGHNKIELFYFLATGWLFRALRAFKRNPQIPTAWWGRPDWQRLLNLNGHELALEFTERFQSELGYRYVKPWPIFKRDAGKGRVMFHMIHASDHPEAPKLMDRAYHNVTKALEPSAQLEMEFGGLNERSPT